MHLQPRNPQELRRGPGWILPCGLRRDQPCHARQAGAERHRGYTDSTAWGTSGGPSKGSWAHGHGGFKGPRKAVSRPHTQETSGDKTRWGRGCWGQERVDGVHEK